MTPDDQMTIDYEIDTHARITEDDINRALNIFMIPPIYDAAYDWLVRFLEPLDEELPIIEKCVKDWCS